MVHWQLLNVATMLWFSSLILYLPKQIGMKYFSIWSLSCSFLRETLHSYHHQYLFQFFHLTVATFF